MMDGMGPMQLVVVLVIVVPLFGKQISGTVRDLGPGMKEFKKGMSDSGGRACDAEKRAERRTVETQS